MYMCVQKCWDVCTTLHGRVGGVHGCTGGQALSMHRGWARVHAHVCWHMCIYTSTWACVQVCVGADVCAGMCVHARLGAHVCRHVCKHIYTGMYAGVYGCTFVLDVCACTSMQACVGAHVCRHVYCVHACGLSARLCALSSSILARGRQEARFTDEAAEAQKA